MKFVSIVLAGGLAGGLAATIGAIGGLSAFAYAEDAPRGPSVVEVVPAKVLPPAPTVQDLERLQNALVRAQYKGSLAAKQREEALDKVIDLATENATLQSQLQQKAAEAEASAAQVKDLEAKLAKESAPPAKDSEKPKESTHNPVEDLKPGSPIPANQSYQPEVKP